MAEGEDSYDVDSNVGSDLDRDLERYVRYLERSVRELQVEKKILLDELSQ